MSGAASDHRRERVAGRYTGALASRRRGGPAAGFRRAPLRPRDRGDREPWMSDSWIPFPFADLCKHVLRQLFLESGTRYWRARTESASGSGSSGPASSTSTEPAASVLTGSSPSSREPRSDRGATSNAQEPTTFSLSHPTDGVFRLEIHALPSELDEATARRLRAVLLGLARELGDGDNGDELTEKTSTSPHRTLGTHSHSQRESAR